MYDAPSHPRKGSKGNLHEVPRWKAHASSVELLSGALLFVLVCCGTSNMYVRTPDGRAMGALTSTGLAGSLQT